MNKPAARATEKPVRHPQGLVPVWAEPPKGWLLSTEKGWKTPHCYPGTGTIHALLQPGHAEAGRHPEVRIGGCPPCPQAITRPSGCLGPACGLDCRPKALPRPGLLRAVLGALSPQLPEEFFGRAGPPG